MCARSSVQILHIQVFILDFLILCSQEILHEIPEEKFLDFPIQEAPSPSNMLEDDSCGHTTFSNVLRMAPYRGWDSLNFDRMRSYVDAILDTQKEHVRALREDPSYFADTLLEFEQHAPYKDPKAHCTSFQCGTLDHYRRKIIVYITEDRAANKQVKLLVETGR